MKVLVLGAGLIGTATAYFLARDGHAVTVLDRQPGPGLETSYANGGQISVCHTQPWAAPGTPLQALRWMGRDDAPLAFRWTRWDPALWAWGLRFLGQCTAGAYRRNMERAVRIALYSRDQLKALRATENLSYDLRTQGIIKIYRSRSSLDKGLAAMRTTEAWGLHQKALGVDEVVALEPALADAAPLLTGGIYAPDDESGDAHRFTTQLAERATALGADFRGGVAVTGLETAKGRLSGVRTDRGTLTADATVLALGSYSPLIARTAGLRIPVYPAKGYSITVDIPPDGVAPTVSITDEDLKMVFSRFGNRLRAAGTAELAGWNTTLREARATLIRRETGRLFPRAGVTDQAPAWCGLRPKTPDSAPIIGPAPGVQGLWLNTGHGTLGWTMSCGSGRLVADLIGGKTPEISPDGLGLDRF